MIVSYTGFPLRRWLASVPLRVKGYGNCMDMQVSNTHILQSYEDILGSKYWQLHILE